MKGEGLFGRMLLRRVIMFYSLALTAQLVAVVLDESGVCWVGKGFFTIFKMLHDWDGN